MSTRSQDLSQARIQHIFLRLTTFWLAVILALAAWNAWQTYAATLGAARASAAESFRKDVIYRSWAATHGGVYVPVTAQTPPNPDLSGLAERDISTPSGIRLTLINPAYMTRQAHELGNRGSGSKGHLTSLTPLRAANAADEWETRALQAFQGGVKEVSSIEVMEGLSYFRYMRPLSTEAACLKCHEKQGYQLGDIRGGISASIPWAPYGDSLRTQILASMGGYCAIWTLGFVGLRRGRRRLHEDLAERMRIEDALRTSEQSQQAARAQLERGNAELQRVNVKLAQSQVQLLQSEKLAAVGQLAAGVAHEINNPLGFVSSNMASLKDYLERLLRLIDAYQRCATGSEESDRAALQGALQEADLAFLREDAMALLQESREGLERVKKIVRDLREFSRVDSASWQESDLIAGLESTVNVAAGELAGKVDVVRQYADLPLVRCHLAQINQVFLSLLTNALQAIEGHGQIALSAGVQGDEVWVRVQDNGVGMSPEVQRRMFEPFFTTRAVGQGVGLGLSVAYDTVKNHGGRIDVGSEPGRGTWVQVWLPVNGSEAAPGAP